jgi:hypothetical protein
MGFDVPSDVLELGIWFHPEEYEPEYHSYIYDDEVAPLLPTGTVIIMTGWYENTAHRPLVDPEVWATRGSRSFDEMSHAWIAVTHLTEEGYDHMAQDREQTRVVSQDGGG